MSPVLMGAIGVALWVTPGVILAVAIWRALTSGDPTPDPVFVDELEEWWRLPAREHSA